MKNAESSKNVSGEFEELPSTTIGDRVLRVRRRHRLSLRQLSWSAVRGVIRDFVMETPFIMMLPVITILLLLFAGGIYFAEVSAPGSNIDSYGEALWDSVVLMTTAGTMSEPVTTAGHVIGAIWTVLGCLLFYGTIIASASAYFLLPLSSYFLLPRKGEEAKLVATIQYNLGRLQELSTSDIEALKDEIVVLLDATLERHREK
jgi:voltage-gated potassium channel